MNPNILTDNFSWRYNALLPMYALIPLSMAYKLAKYQSYWHSKFQKKESAIIREEMRCASFELISKHLADYYCMVAHEALDSYVLPKANRMVHLQGFEKIIKARQQGKRVLLTTGHYGRFWMAASAMRAKGLTVGSIIHAHTKKQYPYIQPTLQLKNLKKLRQRLGGPFLLEKQDLYHSLHKILDQHLMTIMFDTPYISDAKNCVEVSFLGKQIKVSSSVYHLAYRTNALVAPFFMQEQGNGRSNVSCEELLEPCHYSEKEFMQKLAYKLEQCIYQRPGQWWLWASFPILRGIVNKVPKIYG